MGVRTTTHSQPGLSRGTGQHRGWDVAGAGVRLRASRPSRGSRPESGAFPRTSFLRSSELEGRVLELCPTFHFITPFHGSLSPPPHVRLIHVAANGAV